jgi:hypothetical protein
VTAIAEPDLADNPETDPHPADDGDPSRYLPACGAENEFFTFSPLELADFMGLIPLGNLAPPAHTFPTDHMYFHINRVNRSQWELGTVRVPVVSPGHIWILEITVSEVLTADPAVTDYSIRFAPCRELRAFFIHMTSLSDDLLQNVGADFDRCEEYETGGDRYRMCTARGLNIEVLPGQPIGTAGGTMYSNALDLGVYDLRLNPLPFANSRRWSELSLHVACPLDYFSIDVRAALSERLGSGDATALRTAEPRCGEVEQDEPGSAQGVWFTPGTEDTNPEDPHLALVHDNIDPSIAVFSVGLSPRSSGIASDLYYFHPEKSGATNLDFDSVTPGEIICYHGFFDRFGTAISDAIILEMVGPGTLRIEGIDTGCDDPPWSFTNRAREFER